MKTRHLLWLSLPVILLAGCVRDGTPSDPLRGVAASVLAANAFDHAQLALLRNDSAGLKAAGQDLRRAADAVPSRQITEAQAVALTNAATTLDQLSAQSLGDEKNQLQDQSDAMFWSASSFAPAKNPDEVLDPFTLNGIGYFLAEHGKTKDDFQKAVVYTAAAYRTWPDPDLSTYLTVLFSNPSAIPYIAPLGKAMAPLDSYAWALFKDGRLVEASQREEDVIQTITSIAPGAMAADFPFHLAEIYRAQGEKDKAKTAYALALSASPSPEMTARIKSGLNSLDSTRV